ncbi:MAG: radical SAM protein [Myxococcaceae bacterium]|nr:radical SAM protein [Myxococcaceae bacterium]
MQLAQRIVGTEAEGPGRRAALWVQGCSLRCPGCCNPELFTAQGGTATDVDALARALLADGTLEGISLLGGEPTEQAEGCAALAAAVQRGGLSVMLYTGYTLAELRAQKSPHVDALLGHCDLVVDGRYERDQHDTTRRWIGSKNQTLHFLSPRYRADDPRFAAPNTIELRLDRGGVTVNGWPRESDLVWRRR